MKAERPKRPQLSATTINGRTIITAGHEESALVQIRAHHQLLVIAEKIGIVQRVVGVLDEEVLVDHRIEAEVLPAFDDVVLGLLQAVMRKSGRDREQK